MSRDNDTRTANWFKWWICVLLLLATTLNYMDRQTLSQTGVRIKSEFSLNNERYGYLESAFNVAFAVGALAIGWLVDRGNVRVIYPLVVVGWSMAGFAAGFANSFITLLLCRFCLGIFEAGNWPCGITTVRRVLKPEERTLGNGMFQSGTALGAIITPLVINVCLHYSSSLDMEESMKWRLPFRIIGAIGILWAVAWLLTVKTHHVQPNHTSSKSNESYWSVWKDRRFWLLIIVIVGINITWRSFGFWLPTFLRESKGYEEKTANYISSTFFFSADVGSMAVGFVTLLMCRRGVEIHKARLICFLCCAILTSLALLAVALPAGLTFLVTILAIGFGALGLFPLYFALSQELSAKHQGKVTGTLGCINALTLAAIFPLQGKLVDLTGTFSYALGLAGFTPMIAFIFVLFFWSKSKQSNDHVQ